MFCGLTCSCRCVPSLSRGSFLFHPVRSFTDSSKKYNKCAWSRSLGVFPPRRTFRRLFSDVVFRSPEGRPSPTSPIPEKERPSAMVPHVAALRTELLHIPEKAPLRRYFFPQGKGQKKEGDAYAGLLPFPFLSAACRRRGIRDRNRRTFRRVPVPYNICCARGRTYIPCPQPSDSRFCRPADATL